MKVGKEKNCEVKLRMKLNTTLNHQSADMAPKGRRNNFFLTFMVFYGSANVSGITTKQIRVHFI